MTPQLFVIVSALLQCPTFAYVAESENCQTGSCIPPLDDAGALIQSKAKVHLHGKELNSSEESSLPDHSLKDALKDDQQDSIAAMEKPMQSGVEKASSRNAFSQRELRDQEKIFWQMEKHRTSEYVSAQEVVRQANDDHSLNNALKGDQKNGMAAMEKLMQSAVEKVPSRNVMAQREQIDQEKIFWQMDKVRHVNDSSIVRSMVSSAFIWVGIILLVILGLLFLLCVTTPCWLGRAVETVIEGLDKEMLGVDIVFDSISVSAFSARVEIKGFKVCNPTGYKAAHMLEIDTVLLDLNFHVLVWSLLKSRFSSTPIQVIVSHFVFVKFQAMVEKHSFHTSNVKQVLDHVTEQVLDHDTKQKRKKREDAGKLEMSGESVDATGGHWLKKLKPKPQITIREVKIQDIDVRFQVEGQLFGKSMGTGCDIAIADIEYKDFSEERGSYIADDIALFVLETLLKTIVTNIAGRTVGNHIF